MGRISKLRTYIVCATILCYPILLLFSAPQANALSNGDCSLTGGASNYWDLSDGTTKAVFGSIQTWTTARILKITVDYDHNKIDMYAGTGLTGNSNVTYPTAGQMQFEWALKGATPNHDQLLPVYGANGNHNLFTAKAKAVHTNTNVTIKIYAINDATPATCYASNSTPRGTTAPNYVPPVVIPPAPVLTGEAGETSNTLNWTATTGATSYKLRIGSQVIYEGPQTTYVHEGLTSGTEYIYKVYAVNSAGESPQSNDLTLTTTVPPPPPETITERDKHMLALAMSTAIGWTAVRSFRWRGTE